MNILTHSFNEIYQNILTDTLRNSINTMVSPINFNPKTLGQQLLSQSLVNLLIIEPNIKIGIQKSNFVTLTENLA